MMTLPPASTLSGTVARAFNRDENPVRATVRRHEACTRCRHQIDVRTMNNTIILPTKGAGIMTGSPFGGLI